MALSQLQCLDDSHINVRTNESKPEFFYSEEQRLALETLLEGGREVFEQFLKTSSARSFLSDLEVTRLTGSVEAFSPDASVRVSGDADEAHCSLQYWPDRSDTSLPDLDMGWPDCGAYRGVTRAHVYAQPPLEGDAHIKEVVRKTIAQAQKVIAVVMDLFTDVDIFQDLLDASFKRKVAVYIILEATGVPHFLKMCERATMHTGHLKNLRVRSIRGAEFFTRSSKKVCGSQSQKFMFVDGDKAVSGSYSFTWTASRLDRNIITVLTGQAVDAFDKLFRDLYVVSNGVNLSKIKLDNEPTPGPAPQSAPALLPSATMALKLINPKYALVSGSTTANSTPTAPETCMAKIGSVKQMKKLPEAPPIHPGLLYLEKANMIAYLPVWPEPDPPSDVIGFINIRDYNKPLQAHLMRSELFEVSQAIRFKDPFQVPEEPLFKRASSNPKVESLYPLDGLTNEQPIMQPQTSPEENNRHARPLDQLPPSLPPRSLNEHASGFLTTTNETKKDSAVVHGMDKRMEDRPVYMNPQLQPVRSSRPTESKPSIPEPKTMYTPTAYFETSSERTTEIPNYDSNFSSASEEYFECSDSVTVDSGFEGMVNGMPPGCGLSEQDWHPDDSNTTVTDSQSFVPLQLQQLELAASSYEHESGLKETDEPQHPSGLQEQCDGQHAVGMLIHWEPDKTEAGPVIQADRLQAPETDANSPLAPDGKPFKANPLKANTDSQVVFKEKVESLDRKGEELPIHELGHVERPVVNELLNLESVEAKTSELAENELLSSSALQAKVSSPVIVVHTKTESQSIVFSDPVKEVPLLKLKPQLHSRSKDASNLSPAIKVNDVKHSRHQEKVATLRAVFERDPHAERAQKEIRNLPAQLTDTEELFIQEAVEVEGICSFVPELKQNAAEQTVDIKAKSEPKRQKAQAGLKGTKHSTDVHSSSKDEPVWGHARMHREHRNQPEAKAKLEGDVRKLRRPSPKPVRAQQEARAGSAKPLATKSHSTDHPTLPAAPATGAQNYLHGKQLGRNRAVNALLTLPDKLSARRSAPTRSSQSPIRRSRTEPSPSRVGSSPKQPQAREDKPRTIHLGQSSSRQRSASTTEDSPSSTTAFFLRRVKSLRRENDRVPSKEIRK
ncbi:uncharacterized protein fam83ga [Salminus brasiliensis]|uniref:uncharacterized protein fam83ga n=1 Tax=Salminus brasiliensis TaxID=930266 RepID=UPI003B83231A